MKRTGAAVFKRVEQAAREVAALPPRASLAREMRRVRRAEIFASTALAGSRLGAAEVDALLDTGRALGDHALDDYILVRAYAVAANYVAEQRVQAAGRSGPLITLDELRQLNAKATAGSSARGGAWRQANFAPESGIVAPAAWLVARETTTLIDRFGRGPQELPVVVWLARSMGRFARLRPFEAANGRTVRLAINLALRRLDYPPPVFESRDRLRFPAALAAAETNEPDPLARLLSTALVRTCNQLSAAAEGRPEAVQALREAAGADYDALAKAAQRGRLRTVVRGGRYYTTPEWIAEYNASRQRPRVR